MERIHLLVVDDHTVVRKGLCSLLSAEKYGIDVVGEAADGQDAIEKTLALQPEVILLDLAMPRMGGLEAIPGIKQANPNARILILTSFAEDERVLEAVRAGALGFLRKDSSPDELVSTIRSVYLNRVSLPPEVVYKAMLGARQQEEDQQVSELTDREMDVLAPLARGKTNAEIGELLNLSEKTVSNYVSTMLEKLNLSNRIELATYAVEHHLFDRLGHE